MTCGDENVFYIREYRKLPLRLSRITRTILLRLQQGRTFHERADCDDDDAVCVLGARVLERIGFAVETVGDGERALELLRSRRFDVIVLDLLLPRVNGFEVLHEMKAVQPETLNRVVIFTAATEETLRHFDSSNVFALLQKPLDITSLQAVAKNCAENARIANMGRQPGAANVA